MLKKLLVLTRGTSFSRQLLPMNRCQGPLTEGCSWFIEEREDHVFSMRATMAECAFQGAMDFIASACLVSLEQDAKLKKSADLQHVKTEEHVPKLQLEDICVRALWGFLERIAKHEVFATQPHVVMTAHVASLRIHTLVYVQKDSKEKTVKLTTSAYQIRARMMVYALKWAIALSAIAHKVLKERLVKLSASVILFTV